MADEKLSIDVTAKDDASKVIDPLIKKVDELEHADPTVDVGADTKTADQSVDAFADKLKKLSSTDQVVLLALRAGAAQTELADLATQLATIDAADPTVDVKLARFDQVSGDLDQIESKIKAIGDADPDAGAHLEAARKKLDGIGESAGGAQDAVHSMAGNAVGDFAATATGIGPLGEALGQLTEQIGKGEGSFKELATAGLGLGAISAGMFVVNRIMGEFADTAARAAAIKVFRTADVDAFTKSLRDATDVAGDYVDAIEKAGKLEGLLNFSEGFVSIGGQIKTDLIGPLNEAGESVLAYAAAVTGTDDDLAAFDTAVRNSGASVDAQRTIIDAAKSAHEDYGAAVEKSTAFDKALGDTQRARAAESDRYTAQADAYAQSQLDAAAADAAATVAADDYNNQLADVAASHRNQVDDTRKVINALRDARTATNDLDLAYQGLQGTIDHDQSMINLQNRIANVQTAAQNAWDAQVDANKALADGAKDAGEKQAAADQAARDYQSSINDLKSDIVTLGETAKANPVDVNSTLEKIDQGDYTSLTADAEAYFRRNPIDAATRLTLINRVIAGVGQPDTLSQPGTRSIGPAVVNNFLARPAAAAETARAAGRRARINGR